ncbi:MAG: hypothetical protein ACT4N8_03560 [Sphingosinicella sp.]|uniref:hypothetical protein n=1 Tax=Sphingosinicella sp. TaxID=1917971 RepID=UPI00403809CE
MSENEPTPESPDPPPPDPAALAEGDPEIAALLGFEPVVRKCKRRDGWTVERQRGFIAALARIGNVDFAAHEVGRTSAGAWKLRSDAGGTSFAAAWDGAIDLFHARNPGTSRRGGRARGAWASPPPPPPPEEPDEDARWQELCDGILTKYLLKLEAEREARLAGRIVEADYYVRQLTWLEVALDLGGLGEHAVAMLMGLKRGERHAGQIAATPVSLLLDQLRRAYWEEEGGPERPPPPALGPHADADASPGEPLECQWTGYGEADREARQRKEAIQAEAQRLWEEKAKTDAAAWATRLGSSPGFPGEGDHPKDGGGASSSNREESRS